MNYKETLDYLNSIAKFGSKLGLDRINKLLELLDNPQEDLKVIHIAGTNGKGSTSSYISHILIEAGYNVGLFTSPSLENYNGRIKINGVSILDKDLARIITEVREKADKLVSMGIEHPTEFEIATTGALLYFKEKKVDFAILEVGLGGRFDSTNVVKKPVVTVITPISMDHTNILGESLKDIAWEKAGIIKDKVPVICFPQEEEAFSVIENVAKEKNSELIVVPIKNINIWKKGKLGNEFDFGFNKYNYKNLKISLIGEHQVFNSCVALTTILTLKNKGIIKITDNQIREGLKKTKWIGRLEILKRNPYFVIDGAHNLQGVQALKKSLKMFKYKNLILGISILKDKDYENIIKEIVPLADMIIITENDNPRVLKAENIKQIIDKCNKKSVIEKNIQKAVEKSISLADKDDLILFCGSFYLIKDVRRILINS